MQMFEINFCRVVLVQKFREATRMRVVPEMLGCKVVRHPEARFFRSEENCTGLALGFVPAISIATCYFLSYLSRQLHPPTTSEGANAYSHHRNMAPPVGK